MKKLLSVFLLLFTCSYSQAQNCFANFSTVVGAPPNPMLVTATNNSTQVPIANSFTQYIINWGDGNSNLMGAPTSNISHTYAVSGAYLITLNMSVIDSFTQANLCTSVDTHSVVVISSPCATTISKSNVGATYTFHANNIGGGTGMSYAWNFGDGGIGSGATVNHTYTVSGNYIVSCVATGSGCVDTQWTTVNFYNGTSINCNSVSANFTTTGIGLTKNFTNTSNNLAGMPIKKNASWNFGDGSAMVSNQNNTSHTYTAAGNYTVTMTAQWYDSVTLNVLCTKTLSYNIAVVIPPNQISGDIFWDTTLTLGSAMQFKVWLINFDQNTNMLTAIDSTLISGTYSANYLFNNVPVGSYRTKAAVLSGTTAANLFIPTYHDTSTYWSSATVINHTGATTANRNIFMKAGTWSGGPGFIGGNVIWGANKGTGNNGFAGLLITLQNNFGEPIRFTYTDNNGDYSFGNLPAGDYVVYPEDMNYITIPSSVIKLASGKYSVTGINFKHTSTQIKPITTGIVSIANDMFLLYPNPTDGKLTISWKMALGKVSIQLIDVTGREITHLNPDTKSATNLDFSHLNTGVYFLKIVSDNGQFIERVLIQR
ncbi:MAG: PKD domain-containing protein [Bacteroidetes bacterium]|nr:PKD domain-containing protein [Bacteroidota bacterium]MBS1739076.1 PKD domain-containing protein [Bacteroidota bacterium]